MEILIQLLLAHILTDFVIQPKKWVDSKVEKGVKGPYLWIHSLIAGLLTYLLLHNWSSFTIPFIISISHFLIDCWKIGKVRKLKATNSAISKKGDKKTEVYYFFIDQFAHIIVLLVAWLFLIQGFDKVFPKIIELITNIKSIAIITGLVTLVWPVGIVIGKITEPFQKELKNKDDSLSMAGAYIGVFERLLIFIFIIIGQYAAIGFLIASKSILRVSTDKDIDGRKKTEYVLIGTLISFTIAIVISLVVQRIVGQ